VRRQNSAKQCSMTALADVGWMHPTRADLGTGASQVTGTPCATDARTPGVAPSGWQIDRPSGSARRYSDQAVAQLRSLVKLADVGDIRSHRAFGDSSTNLSTGGSDLARVPHQTSWGATGRNWPAPALECCHRISAHIPENLCAKVYKSKWHPLWPSATSCRRGR